MATKMLAITILLWPYLCDWKRLNCRNRHQDYMLPRVQFKRYNFEKYPNSKKDVVQNIGPVKYNFFTFFTQENIRVDRTIIIPHRVHPDSWGMVIYESEVMTAKTEQEQFCCGLLGLTKLSLFSLYQRKVRSKPLLQVCLDSTPRYESLKKSMMEFK